MIEWAKDFQSPENVGSACMSTPTHLGHDVKADLATDGESQVQVAELLLQDAHQRGPARRHDYESLDKDLLVTFSMCVKPCACNMHDHPWFDDKGSVKFW